MDRQKLYMFLRINGLTPAGACGLMGNLGWESDFQCNNVENRCSMSDEDYTYNVDQGFIWREQFAQDAYGYGLAQWTFWSRKAGLYDLAKSRNASIADENVQMDWLLTELTRDYPTIYKYLCTTENLYEATDRCCREYEQPAVNNVGDRYKIAQKCYIDFATTEGATLAYAGIIPETEEYYHTGSCEITVKVLTMGAKGRDVFLLQCGLTDMGFNCGMPDGDFGPLTLMALNELKSELGFEKDGIADQAVWQKLLE